MEMKKRREKSIPIEKNTNLKIMILFEIRCVVMCDTSSENGIHVHEEKDEEGVVNGGDRIEDYQESGDGVDKPPSWFQPQNHKTRLLQLHGSKYAAGLRADIQVEIYIF